jgi:hypothetical protein
MKQHIWNHVVTKKVLNQNIFYSHRLTHVTGSDLCFGKLVAVSFIMKNDLNGQIYECDVFYLLPRAQVDYTHLKSHLAECYQNTNKY